MKKRIISIITALALCLSLCPAWAFAAEADPALCKHHPEHTEDCGYIAPTEGRDCGHEHTEDCYTLGVLPDADSGDYYEIGADTENLLDCQHVHDSECGYVQADPGQPCGYECRICPIEDLIAALPDTVTEDKADEVRAQLDHILALYGELTEDEQGQINLSRCYELQEALDGANAPNPIAESVTYQEASWNGGVTYTTKTADSCTPVTDSTTEWTDGGWYVVSGTVTISEPITVTGEVHLILVDGCTLNAEKGIVVTTGNSLTIYAQSGGTGTLMATGTVDGNNASAGIGGSTSSPNSGTITIHGGVINAIGGCVGPPTTSTATSSLNSSRRPTLRTVCRISSRFWPSTGCSSLTKSATSPWTSRVQTCSSSSLPDGMRKRPPFLPPTRLSPSGTRSLPTSPSPPPSWIVYCITVPLSTSRVSLTA